VASYLDGTATLTLLPLEETYVLNFPSAYGRGILFGTLLMELCGDVYIKCNETQCKAEIEFKAKPFFGGEYNAIAGKIKKGKDTVYSLSGKWDDKIFISNCKNKQSQWISLVSSEVTHSEILWDSTKAKRVPKITRSLDQQEEFESQRLWTNVTIAIKNRDQKEATAEKTKLEEVQRKEQKERTEEWIPRLFKKNAKGEWVYRYINLSKYSPEEEGGGEDEEDGIIFSTGIGKQATIDAEEKNYAAYSEIGSNSIANSKEIKAPGRSFSGTFLRTSTTIDRK